MSQMEQEPLVPPAIQDPQQQTQQPQQQMAPLVPPAWDGTDNPQWHVTGEDPTILGGVDILTIPQNEDETYMRGKAILDRLRDMVKMLDHNYLSNLAVSSQINEQEARLAVSSGLQNVDQGMDSTLMGIQMTDFSRVPDLGPVREDDRFPSGIDPTSVDASQFWGDKTRELEAQGAHQRNPEKYRQITDLLEGKFTATRAADEDLEKILEDEGLASIIDPSLTGQVTEDVAAGAARGLIAGGTPMSRQDKLDLKLQELVGEKVGGRTGDLQPYKEWQARKARLGRIGGWDDMSMPGSMAGGEFRKQADMLAVSDETKPNYKEARRRTGYLDRPTAKNLYPDLLKENLVKRLREKYPEGFDGKYGLDLKPAYAGEEMVKGTAHLVGSLAPWSKAAKAGQVAARLGTGLAKNGASKAARMGVRKLFTSGLIRNRWGHLAQNLGGSAAGFGAVMAASGLSTKENKFLLSLPESDRAEAEMWMRLEHGITGAVMAPIFHLAPYSSKPIEALGEMVGLGAKTRGAAGNFLGQGVGFEVLGEMGEWGINKLKDESEYIQSLIKEGKITPSSGTPPLFKMTGALAAGDWDTAWESAQEAGHRAIPGAIAFGGQAFISRAMAGEFKFRNTTEKAENLEAKIRRDLNPDLAAKQVRKMSLEEALAEQDVYKQAEGTVAVGEAESTPEALQAEANRAADKAALKGKAEINRTVDYYNLEGKRRHAVGDVEQAKWTSATVKGEGFTMEGVPIRGEAGSHEGGRSRAKVVAEANRKADVAAEYARRRTQETRDQLLEQVHVERTNQQKLVQEFENRGEGQEAAERAILEKTMAREINPEASSVRVELYRVRRDIADLTKYLEVSRAKEGPYSRTELEVDLRIAEAEQRALEMAEIKISGTQRSDIKPEAGKLSERMPSSLIGKEQSGGEGIDRAFSQWSNYARRLKGWREGGMKDGEPNFPRGGMDSARGRASEGVRVDEPPARRSEQQIFRDAEKAAEDSLREIRLGEKPVVEFPPVVSGKAEIQVYRAKPDGFTAEVKVGDRTGRTERMPTERKAREEALDLAETVSEGGPSARDAFGLRDKVEGKLPESTKPIEKLLEAKEKEALGPRDKEQVRQELIEAEEVGDQEAMDRLTKELSETKELAVKDVERAEKEMRAADTEDVVKATGGEDPLSQTDYSPKRPNEGAWRADTPEAEARVEALVGAAKEVARMRIPEVKKGESKGAQRHYFEKKANDNAATEAQRIYAKARLEQNQRWGDHRAHAEALRTTLTELNGDRERFGSSLGDEITAMAKSWKSAFDSGNIDRIDRWSMRHESIMRGPIGIAMSYYKPGRALEKRILREKNLLINEGGFAPADMVPMLVRSMAKRLINPIDSDAAWALERRMRAEPDLDKGKLGKAMGRLGDIVQMPHFMNRVGVDTSRSEAASHRQLSDRLDQVFKGKDAILPQGKFSDAKLLEIAHEIEGKKKSLDPEVKESARRISEMLEDVAKSLWEVHPAKQQAEERNREIEQTVTAQERYVENTRKRLAESEAFEASNEQWIEYSRAKEMMGNGNKTISEKELLSDLRNKAWGSTKKAKLSRSPSLTGRIKGTEKHIAAIKARHKKNTDYLAKGHKNFALDKYLPMIQNPEFRDTFEDLVDASLSGQRRRSLDAGVDSSRKAGSTDTFDRMAHLNWLMKRKGKVKDEERLSLPETLNYYLRTSIPHIHKARLLQDIDRMLWGQHMLVQDNLIKTSTGKEVPELYMTSKSMGRADKVFYWTPGASEAAPYHKQGVWYKHYDKSGELESVSTKRKTESDKQFFMLSRHENFAAKGEMSAKKFKEARGRHLEEINHQQARTSVWGYRNGWMTRASGAQIDNVEAFLKGARVGFQRQVDGDPAKEMIDKIGAVVHNAAAIMNSASVRAILGGNWLNLHSPFNNLAGGIMNVETFLPQHGKASRSKIYKMSADAVHYAANNKGRFRGGLDAGGKPTLGRSAENLRTSKEKLAEIERTQGVKGREKRELEDDVMVFLIEEDVPMGSKINVIASTGIRTVGKDPRLKNPYPSKFKKAMHGASDWWGQKFDYTEGIIRSAAAADGYLYARSKGMSEAESRTYGRAHEHQLHMIYTNSSKSQLLQNKWGSMFATLSTFPAHNSTMLYNLGKESKLDFIKTYMTNWAALTVLGPIIGSQIFGDENTQEVTGQFGGNMRDIPLVGEALENEVLDLAQKQWGYTFPSLPIPIPIPGPGPILDSIIGASQAAFHGVRGDTEMAKKSLGQGARSLMEPTAWRMIRKAFGAQATDGSSAATTMGRIGENILSPGINGEFLHEGPSGKGSVLLPQQGWTQYLREVAFGRNRAQAIQTKRSSLSYHRKSLRESDSHEGSMRMTSMFNELHEMEKSQVSGEVVAGMQQEIIDYYKKWKGTGITRGEWKRRQRAAVKSTLPSHIRAALGQNEKLDTVQEIADLLRADAIPSRDLWKTTQDAITGDFKGWLFSKKSMENKRYRAAVETLIDQFKKWDERRNNE